MIPYLLGFWTAVLTHLWQTTLVLIPLMLIARLMRNAPGAARHSLWTIALAKFFIPFSFLGEPIQATLRSLMPAKGTTVLPVEIVPVTVISAVVDPARGFGLEDKVMGLVPAGALVGVSTLWGTVALLMLLRLVRNVVFLSRTHGEPLSALPADEGARLESLATRAGVHSREIVLTNNAVVPSVVGLWRPRLVLPRHILKKLGEEDLCAILLHERAHCVRRDPFRGVVQRICLAAFFFYLPIWLVIRRLHETAELACDERAVRAGCDPADYGRALARVFSLGLDPVVGWGAMGRGSGSLLHRRLVNIYDTQRRRRVNAYRALLLCGVLVVMAGLFVPIPTFARDKGGNPLAPGSVLALDVTPEIIEYCKPEYPERARKAGVEGRVLLSMRISASGEVDSLVIEEGVGGYPELGEAAAAAARRWLFEPGKLHGEPVTSWIKAPVIFTLQPRHGIDESRLPVLDTMPELMEQRSPIYPVRAREDHAGGRVILNLHVSASGVVDSVLVDQGVDGYPEFGESAREAALDWRFAPGTRDGQAVDAWVRCPVLFRLDSSKGQPQAREG
jgi:TonB family protein